MQYENIRVMKMQERILKARERRWNTRCSLADKFSLPVVSITVNIPGPIKTRDEYIRAHSIILEDFEKAVKDKGFAVVYRDVRLADDGPEAFVVLKGGEVQLKRVCVMFEETHPLGRLADIDVIDSGKRVLSRQDIGAPERKCYLCDEPAQRCIILRKHPLEEVIKEVNRILADCGIKGQAYV
jgi:holo-ACP synthase CitX